MSLGGAECSTGRNPLAQLSKVVNNDTQLQRDRLVARPGPMGVEGGMRTVGVEMQQMDKQLMDEFYTQQNANAPFAFDAMRQELEALRASTPGTVPAASQNWAAEFGPQFAHLPPQEQAAHMEAAFQSQQHQGHQFDAAEFTHFQAEQQKPQHAQIGMPVTATVPGTTQFYRPQQFSGYQVYNSGIPFQYMHRHHAASPLTQQQQQSQQSKGKEKMIELDDENWEAQFKELEHAEDQQAKDEEAQQAIEEELQRQGETMFGDFQSIWDGINDDVITNGFDFNAEFDSTKTWEPELSSTKSIPSMGEYMFEPDNPYLQMDDPFAEGKRLMETGGNLSLAALAFEAAIQRNKEHVEAWTMLGNAQAQNEKETPAIRALETALKLDPSNLIAMMNLAISYTNEGYETIAFTTLERWLSTKYPHLTTDLPPLPSIDRQTLHDRVTSLFIQAAQLSPEGETMDSDVQVGLGVLFYGNEEYDKAVDCFNAALAHDFDARDKNHLLWNRLGATLANSNRSEEAITAYERALQINPNFVRARYNLGVSCINIGCYDQAAQHLLSALAMQKVAEEKARQDAGKVGVDPNIVMNQSTNLVDTLRRVFTTMGRRDLADLVGTGMDVDVFRAEFDF